MVIYDNSLTCVQVEGPENPERGSKLVSSNGTRSSVRKGPVLRCRCHLAQNSITRGDVYHLERFLTTHPSDVSNKPVVACTRGSILDRAAGGPLRTSRRGVDGRAKDIIGFYSLLNILASHGQVTDLRSIPKGLTPRDTIGVRGRCGCAFQHPTRLHAENWMISDVQHPYIRSGLREVLQTCVVKLT